MSESNTRGRRPGGDLAARIERALFGCEDGSLLDDEDTSVPVGEYRRLLREFLASPAASTTWSNWGSAASTNGVYRSAALNLAGAILDAFELKGQDSRDRAVDLARWIVDTHPAPAVPTDIRARLDRATVPTCCARDALRANIANAEGRYVGGYHGDGQTAMKANASLDMAVRRHPGHELTQPDRFAGGSDGR